MFSSRRMMYQSKVDIKAIVHSSPLFLALVFPKIIKISVLYSIYIIDLGAEIEKEFVSNIEHL